jgi:hypothetical protein
MVQGLTEHGAGMIFLSSDCILDSNFKAIQWDFMTCKGIFEATVSVTLSCGGS